MRTTSSISFYCRKSKADKKGYSPIEVSLIINSKRVFFNLPRKERSEDFQKLLKKKSSDLNEFLNQVRSKINEAQTELLSLGMAVTSARIREYIQNGGIKTYTVESMFDEYIELLKQRIDVDLSIETYKKYIIVRDEFYAFSNKDMEASAVTPALISNFYAHINQTQKTSTTASKMTKLKTIFRFAFDNGKTPIFPFSTVRIKKDAPVIEYLTPQEIDRIKDHKFDCDRLQRIADLFIFQINSGLAYADIDALQPDDVQEHNGTHYIKKKRVKTGIEYTAVVMPDGMDIWNKYNGNLPKSTNQVMNRYLKEIGIICGIKKNMHSHLARKTYCTLLLNSGVSITTVSKMAGHSNSKITEKHYAKTFDETIFDEVKKVI